MTARHAAAGPILVTGGRGQLGQELGRALAGLGRPHVLVDLPEFDITATGHIAAAMQEHAPQLVVHCAAYTDVDGCEADPARAHLVNAAAAGAIAEQCAALRTPMVHISTDFVFSGPSGTPYEVDRPPAPLGVYGASKAQGEALVRAASSDHWIVRTSWLYGVFGRNFPRAILSALAAGTRPRVVDDQVGSPTYARDLADAILSLCGVAREAAAPFGTYQFCNSGACSWFEFSVAIADLSGWLIHDPSLAPLPISSEELARPAQRPAYSAMSPATCQAAGLGVRQWQSGLGDFLQELRGLRPELFPGR
jgi:dTDP-4-dehydrorhamnose reductase